MDELSRLERWYLSNCDGDWEHDRGVDIGTLDNPGWRLKINLEGTPLEGLPFERIDLRGSETDWLSCWMEANTFHAAGGPLKLRAMLSAFLDWAASTSNR